jgi:hypothetical protein
MFNSQVAPEEDGIFFPEFVNVTANWPVWGKAPLVVLKLLALPLYAQGI